MDDVGKAIPILSSSSERKPKLARSILSGLAIKF
jgi:hypothetical protein